MPFEQITTEEITVKKPVTNRLMTKIKNSLEYLYGAIATDTTEGLQNGSFEIDTGDGIPDSWTRTLYPGGTGSMVTDSIHGAKAFSFVHPGGSGNGGGYLESDYAPISDHEKYLAKWFWKTSIASGLHVQVVARWSDKDKVPISDETIFDTTTGSTTARMHIAGCHPPAGARFCKLRLVGGKSDASTAGTVFFDGVDFGRIAETTQIPAIVCNGSIAAFAVDAWVETLISTVLVGFSNIPFQLTANLDITGTTQDGSVSNMSCRLKINSSYSASMLQALWGSGTTPVTTNHTFVLSAAANPAWPLLVYAQLYESEWQHITSLSFASTAVTATIKLQPAFNARTAQSNESYL